VTLNGGIYHGVAFIDLYLHTNLVENEKLFVDGWTEIYMDRWTYTETFIRPT